MNRDKFLQFKRKVHKSDLNKASELVEKKKEDLTIDQRHLILNKLKIKAKNSLKKKK